MRNAKECWAGPTHPPTPAGMTHTWTARQCLQTSGRPQELHASSHNWPRRHSATLKQRHAAPWAMLRCRLGAPLHRGGPHHSMHATASIVPGVSSYCSCTLRSQLCPATHAHPAVPPPLTSMAAKSPNRNHPPQRSSSSLGHLRSATPEAMRQRCITSP
jgi:hypothetical protein